MLNPEIIKEFGENTRELLMELIYDIGEEGAAKCYAIPGVRTGADGIGLPGSFNTTAVGEEKTNIGWAMHEFMRRHSRTEDEQYMIIMNNKPTKEGIQLWLNSDW